MIIWIRLNNLSLSIRCPERGRGFWVYLCFYPYVAPSGAEVFGCISVSIPTLPLTGQYVFWGDSYPYVAPSGAVAFGCISVSIHTLPRAGQRLLGVSLFLSIRCPERGRGFWVCLCFYPYVAPNGAICVLGGFLSIRCP